LISNRRFFVYAFQHRRDHKEEEIEYKTRSSWGRKGPTTRGGDDQAAKVCIVNEKRRTVPDGGGKPGFCVRTEKIKKALRVRKRELQMKSMQRRRGQCANPVGEPSGVSAGGCLTPNYWGGLNKKRE